MRTDPPNKRRDFEPRRRCRRCGLLNEAGDTKCRNCKARLTATQPRRKSE